MKLCSILLAVGCSVLLMGAADAAGRATNSAFAPKNKIHEKKQCPNNLLQIRGGAGPLDPTQTAKVALVVELAQGLLSSTAPSVSAEQYGFSTNPLNDWTMEAFGNGVISNCILVYCTLFKNASVQTAFQLALIPWIMLGLDNVLNKRASSLGFNHEGQVFNLLVNIFMAYAATQDWADTAIKFFTAWVGVNGVLCAASPEIGVKAWAKKETTISGDVLGLIRAFGFSLLCYAVFLGSMIFYDNSALTAFGHLEVVWLAYHVVSQFIAGDYKKYIIQEGPMMVWALLHLVVIGTILF